MTTMQYYGRRSRVLTTYFIVDTGALLGLATEEEEIKCLVIWPVECNVMCQNGQMENTT